MANLANQMGRFFHVSLEMGLHFGRINGGQPTRAKVTASDLGQSTNPILMCLLNVIKEKSFGPESFSLTIAKFAMLIRSPNVFKHLFGELCVIRGNVGALVLPWTRPSKGKDAFEICILCICGGTVVNVSMLGHV